MHNLLLHLNPEQLAAVTLPAQPALILAGAGSGKTRVLTTRIAWLIQTSQVSPAGVLAVTFTNKAAKEMQARLSTMLPINTRGMWIGTFHGLCNRLLRAHYRDAALPQTFQILDSQDQMSAIKRLLKRLNVDDEKYPAKHLMYFINSAKDQGLRASEVEASDDYQRKFAELYAAYDDQCQREGVVDFAELLLRSYELLTRNQPLREHYQARFKHILVDEFQDTNDLQYKWLKLLAGTQGAVFAVGDDDQSIYAFRGANVGNMSAFEREYHVENLIKLEQNYRSHGHILDTANQLIANNSRRLGKNRVFGGQRFFERAEIKHAIAYLQLIDNLHNDSSFLRVVNFPTRGVGARSIEQLQDAARQYGISLYAAVPYVAGKAGAVLGNFIQLIESLRFETERLPLQEMVQVVIEKSGLIAHYQGEKEGADRIENLEQLVSAAALFVSEEGFMIDAPALVGPRVDSAAPALVSGDGIEIIDADAPLTAIMSPLSAFLSHASLEAGDNQAQAGQDAIQLMTVHSAKGLEFDAVFITGLEEGLFPHENSQEAEDGVEEERRLMYVAITRARKRLYMSFAQTRMLHGQTRYNVRSRFFDELPDEALKWLSPRVEAKWLPNHQKAAWVETPEFGNNSIAQSFTSRKESVWQIGQSVTHQKFGEGVIVNIEGSGTQARANINFGRNGMKLLDLSIAKLERV